MRRSTALGTAVLSLATLTVTAGVFAPAIMGQTESSRPFEYIRQSDQRRTTPPAFPEGPVTLELVRFGRELVLNHGCGDCHSGFKNDPADPRWLAGSRGPEDFNQIGPFKTYAQNLTPDNATGLGRVSARQIFNALRYGLDPEDTPDVVITSNVPGQGNFPAQPHYLAPPMPWPAFRHMADNELWAIVAYLKHGIRPVTNEVPESEGPPDFWASSYTPDRIGPYPMPAYPYGNEEFRP